MNKQEEQAQFLNLIENDNIASLDALPNLFPTEIPDAVMLYMSRHSSLIKEQHFDYLKNIFATNRKQFKFFTSSLLESRQKDA